MSKPTAVGASLFLTDRYAIVLEHVIYAEWRMGRSRWSNSPIEARQAAQQDLADALRNHDSSRRSPPQIPRERRVLFIVLNALDKTSALTNFCIDEAEGIKFMHALALYHEVKP